MSALTVENRPPKSESETEDDVPVVPVWTGPSDREAEFTVFMEQASSALARTAWLLCGDEHQAEDLVQQALTRTYLSWPTARQRDPLAYTRRTLANLRIDSWRKRRREVLMAPSDVPEGPVACGADRHAERDQLVRALATLSTRQRRIVVLRHLDGLSEREVAEDLGISIGTVKSTASRGLAQLRTELHQSDEHTSLNDAEAPNARSGS